ncbi:14665_t:CDS:2, partial [Gigaspora margarita]
IMLCGEEYYIRGQFDYALLYFNKVLEISPNDKTISDLNVAIKLKPNVMEMLILRGKTYFFLEKYDLALFDFIKSVRV